MRQQVGEGSYDQPLLTAELLASVVRRVDRGQRKGFLPHISTVAFHECPEVRRVIAELLKTSGHPPLHTALDHLEASIGVADFHVDHHQPRGSAGSDACSWHVLKGRFGQELAECCVFVHASDCQAKQSLSSDCTDHWKQLESGDWQHHRQNLEVLARLSPHDHLVNLMAFQLSPFLFYATEYIKVLF